MSSSYHDLILRYGFEDSMTLNVEYFESLPLIMVVGREPNNSLPFRTSVGGYDLEARVYKEGGRKRTVAFWDQSYGTVGKTAGLDCCTPENIAREVQASPIVFTVVMPHPAEYKLGSSIPRETRERTDEKEIDEHHKRIFSESRIIDRVKLAILAGHRHGSFRKRNGLGQTLR